MTHSHTDHLAPNELIIRGGAYAHDTGYLYEEVIRWLAEKKLTFDFVSLDCTNVHIPIDDEGGHMGRPNNVRFVKKLKEISVIDEQTKIYINHFSHNAMPLQEYLEREVKEYGFGVVYDGLSIEI